MFSPGPGFPNYLVRFDSGLVLKNFLILSRILASEILSGTKKIVSLFSVCSGSSIKIKKLAHKLEGQEQNKTKHSNSTFFCLFQVFQVKQNKDQESFPPSQFFRLMKRSPSKHILLFFEVREAKERVDREKERILLISFTFKEGKV